MAYYWVTEAQNYIQSLGFGTSRRPINKESQDVHINQWGQDNSYSWDKHDVLRFGSSVETGSIGEGFGDYWAVTVSDVIAPIADLACVVDWDSVSYTSMPATAQATVNTAELLYGPSVASTVRQAFVDRGILTP